MKKTFTITFKFFSYKQIAKPVYLTAMMGVAISSVSLGFLTFFWSFVCVIFNNVGGHARAGELLISLSILTGIEINFPWP